MPQEDKNSEENNISARNVGDKNTHGPLKGKGGGMKGVDEVEREAGEAVEGFDTMHASHVHNISYDYFGDRIATCSSDLRIRVWELDTQGTWRLSGELPRVHNSSIHKVIWVKPDFGQVLASASADGTICIYQESVETGSGRKIWRLKSRLVASTESIMDIDFSSTRGGDLRLAACSRGGNTVRIYAARGGLNLSQWSKHGEYRVSGGSSCQCLSWCPSVFSPAMILVGTGSSVHVCREEEGAQKSEEIQSNTSYINSATRNVRSSGNNTEPEGSVWECAIKLGKRTHGGTILDIVWSPNPGRISFTFATACIDHKIRIFSLLTLGDMDLNPSSFQRPPPTGEGKVMVKKLAELTHPSAVWSLSFDSIGANLASTDDEGNVRIWTRSPFGKWVSSEFISRKDNRNFLENNSSAKSGDKTGNSQEDSKGNYDVEGKPEEKNVGGSESKGDKHSSAVREEDGFWV
ncbi:hypothetical protein AAMO2058_000209800 [Amorphochlora amoebiformis]